MENTQPVLSPHKPSDAEILLRRGTFRVARWVLDKGMSLPEHTASEDLLFICVRSNGTITVEQEIRHLAPGAVVDVYMGERHAVHTDEELEVILILAHLPPQ